MAPVRISRSALASCAMSSRVVYRARLAHHAAAPHHQALAGDRIVRHVERPQLGGGPTLGFGGLLVLDSLFGAKRTRYTRRSLTG
jgi:hypothetical protein